MTDQTKIDFMLRWCLQQSVQLELKGEVGFFRPCVGVTAGSSYLDFMWHEMDYRNPDRPEFWTPEDAYHKHPCMAVLVHDDDYEKAIEQLFEWIKWCEDNGWGVVVKPRETFNERGSFGSQLELMMNGLTMPEIRPT